MAKGIKVKVTGGDLVCLADEFVSPQAVAEYLELSNHTAQINGADAAMDAVLSDDDFIVLSQSVKGG
jgi:hypothetical protein